MGLTVRLSGTGIRRISQINLSSRPWIRGGASHRCTDRGEAAPSRDNYSWAGELVGPWPTEWNNKRSSPLRRLRGKRFVSPGDPTVRVPRGREKRDDQMSA